MRCAASAAGDLEVEVGLMVEGEPAGLSEAELEELAEQLYEDSSAAVRAAALHLRAEQRAEAAPRPLELSVVLCDDAHIRELNREWRGKDAATDVLSFEMEGAQEEEFGLEEELVLEEEGEEEAGAAVAAAAEEIEQPWEEEEEEEGAAELPVTMLGDVVISLDTAARQAAERRHSLHDECRVLLLHGLLHLLGYDHERGPEDEAEMQRAESAVLATLGWRGEGLIAAAADSGGGGSGGGRGSSMHAPAGGASTSSTDRASGREEQQQHRAARMQCRPEVAVLALDMDGTLLDSRSKVLPSSVAAIRAALARGVTVMLATGKARPAALRAMAAVDLAGPGLVVHQHGPGVFLQGLTAFGRRGELVAGGTLDPGVVAAAFEYAAAHGVPLCGFREEECVTLRLHDELLELHHRYYEPLASVAPSIDHIVSGPRLRKLLFMASPQAVEAQLKPHWAAALEGKSAETMQAVPEMLEVVPSGWNKGRALRALLSHMKVPVDAFAAIGDGGNDLSMIELAGPLGVAMGNAVGEVKAAAGLVVADNDSHGVAEAIEHLIL